MGDQMDIIDTARAAGLAVILDGRIKGSFGGTASASAI